MYTDAIEHAHAMIAHIDKKRKALGIDKARDRVLMDMADRQALEALIIEIISSTKEESMSKLVAFAGIQGGYKVVSTAEGQFKNALDTFDAASKIEFPNTGYYLPVIYSLTGMKVETLRRSEKTAGVRTRTVTPAY